MPTLALLPLDDRPITRDLPVRIGAVGGAEVLVPARELLGNLVRTGDRAALGQWLLEAGSQADAVIVALDTLAYGGLIPSRRSPDSLADLMDALAPLKRLKAAKPHLPLFAFGVTMRLSDSEINEEEKPYWDRYGKHIFRWSFHQHRFRAQNNPQDQAIAKEARAAIPDDILEDYLATRERNFTLNQTMVKWAGAGFFDALMLTQDDTASFGVNVEEQQHLQQMVTTTLVQDRVFIYPGADEVASVLVARALNHLAGRTPSLAVSWHPLDGKRIQAMYEDRPLWQTLRGQIRAAGAKEVGNSAPAELEIVVNTPARGQGDLALGLHLDAPDDPVRNLEPLLMTLEEAGRRPMAFADVAYANGADPRLWPGLAQRLDPFQLRGFAAWNTAGNTFGTVVATACASLLPTANPMALRHLLQERVAEDWLYQSELRGRLRQALGAGPPLDILAADLGAQLNEAWQRYFPHHPARFRADLPWQRLFEARVEFCE